MPQEDRMNPPCRRIAIILATALLSTAAALAAPAASPSGVGWPRQFTTARGNTVVVYQPQIETLEGAAITGRAAVSVTRKGETAPVFGVVFFTARVSVDRDARTVSLLSLKVSRVRFPDITEAREKAFAALLENEVPSWHLAGSYDRFLENLKVAERERRSAEGLQNQPPRIVFAETPTVLVTFDGEPQLRAVEGAQLETAVNTPFLVVFDPRSRQYYLAGGKRWWYRAADPKGPWQPIGEPPPEVAALAATAPAPAATPAAGAKAKAGDEPGDDDGTGEVRPPSIVVATEPTELIVSEGPPSLKPVDGLDLLYMDNSESDVLMDLAAQEYYVLLSGRWFKSKALRDGAWSYVPPDALPASFAKIPSDSPAGDVLASVPGTDAAEDAFLDAQIPQTAAVKRSEARLSVQYDGDPKFIGIE